MKTRTQEEIEEIYRNLLFDLGKLAGAMGIAEIRTKLIDDLQKSPKNDFMFAALGRVNAELDLVMAAATMMRARPDNTKEN